jgi:hypothetical protein
MDKLRQTMNTKNEETKKLLEMKEDPEEGKKRLRDHSSKNYYFNIQKKYNPLY